MYYDVSSFFDGDISKMVLKHLMKEECYKKNSQTSFCPFNYQTEYPQRYKITFMENMINRAEVISLNTRHFIKN